MAGFDDQKVCRMQEDDGNSQAVAPPSDTKAPLKLSFTVSKSSSASRPPVVPKADRSEEADDRQFVSEFDGKGRNIKALVRVIPLPEKSWRPEKRMKNILVASEGISSTEERFESETLAAGPQPSVEYGLQLRKETPEILKLATESVQESQRCREDLTLLPDESSMDVYEDVPIEEFGEALLRGMGWEAGMPIGRNAKTVTVPFEAARKVGREGLGAIPAPQPEKVKKYIKPGESRKSKLTAGRVMCIITGKYAGSRGQIAEENRGTYTIALLESGMRLQVKESELAEVGSQEEEKARKKLSRLHIESDHDKERNSHRRHMHSTGSERKRDHTSDRAATRDGHSSEEDPVVGHKERTDRHRKDERYRNSREEDKHISTGLDIKKSSRDDRENHGHDKRGNKDEKHRSRKDGHKELKTGSDRRADFKGYAPEDRYKERSRSSNLEGMSENTKAGSFAGSAADSRMQSWLARDIRVRIINKRAYGEKFYLQKACVVDVVSPSICDIQMDDGGKVFQEVKQEHLETALPKCGGHVLVVGGKYRGQLGKLQERDSDKGVGLVQMDETYEVLTFDLDYLAEFVGALHEMEQ